MNVQSIQEYANWQTGTNDARPKYANCHLEISATNQNMSSMLWYSEPSFISENTLQTHSHYKNQLGQKLPKLGQKGTDPNFCVKWLKKLGQVILWVIHLTQIFGLSK